MPCQVAISGEETNSRKIDLDADSCEEEPSRDGEYEPPAATRNLTYG